MWEQFWHTKGSFLPLDGQKLILHYRETESTIAILALVEL